MNTFALIRLEQVKGVIRFNKLEIDGCCQFDEFCAQILEEGNLAKQLNTAFAIMDQVASMKLLPQNKFKEITPEKEQVKEYEIKTADLRIYLIKEDGYLIILGGKKNSQKSDIKQFRSIKKRYLLDKK